MPSAEALMKRVGLAGAALATAARGAARTAAVAAGVALAMTLGGCALLWPQQQPEAAAAPAPVVAATPVALPDAPAAGSAGAPRAEAPAGPAAEAAPAALPAAPRPDAEPRAAPVPAATQAAFNEAVRMLRAGRLSDAERAFKGLAASHRELAGVHANLGIVHRKLGHLDDSAKALQEAVRLSPRQAAFHAQLGITWRTLGRFDHARKAYETAIELDPTHAGALINLAILHDLYLGEPARAMELYTRGAALLPAEAATINKWLAELKNRKADPKLAGSAAAGAGTPARKEKE